MAIQRIERLGHLERVAYGPAKRLRHVADDGGHPPARRIADLDHRAGERARRIRILHERAGARLYV